MKGEHKRNLNSPTDSHPNGWLFFAIKEKQNVLKDSFGYME